MPRNGSGTMSVSNSFSAGNDIQSSPMNANFTDIASEITNSLPRDGQAAMTGQLKAATGTAAAPSITFGSDTNTGFYRSAADTIGISCGGSEIATFSSSGLVDTDSLPYDKFPSGTLMLFQQTAAPTGWTKQATHDDKALRVVSGTASSGGSVAFTTVFGITATDSHVLTATEMPAHTHGSGSYVTDTHTELQGGNTAGASSGGVSFAFTGNWNHSHNVTGTSGSTGGGGGHTHNIDLQVQYVDLIIAAKD